MEKSMSSVGSICRKPSWWVLVAYGGFCHPWVGFPVGNKWCQGREESHTVLEPCSALQHSPSKHKPGLSITQDQVPTVPILADLSRELKLLGNRKNESTCFSEKLMALEIETRQFLEGGEVGTSRFSLLTAVLIAVQWILQSEVLRPVYHERLGQRTTITHADLRICILPLAMAKWMNCKLYAKLLMYGIWKYICSLQTVICKWSWM